MKGSLCFSVRCTTLTIPSYVTSKQYRRKVTHGDNFKFARIRPPRWDTILTNLTNVSSTGHSGSSSILLMLMYVVVPEKLPGQKRWRRSRRTWIFGRFWRLFKVTPTWLFATFLCLCSFCGGQHTDTNIWSILPFLVFQGVAKIRYT